MIQHAAALARIIVTPSDDAVRTENVFACVSTFREPGRQGKVSACVKSSACTNTSWPVSEADHVLHWLACIQSIFGIFICFHVSGLSVCLHVYACA
jgi:hypothetical protein